MPKFVFTACKKPTCFSVFDKKNSKTGLLKFHKSILNGCFRNDSKAVSGVFLPKLIRYFVLIAFLLLNSIVLPAQFNRNYYERGVFQLREKNYKQAIEYLSYSLERNQNNPDALFYRGFAKYSLGDYIGAEEDFTKCINQSPYHDRAWLYRAIVNNRMMDYEQAYSDFDKAIELQKDDPYVYFQRGISLLYLNKFNESLQDCNKAIDMGLNNVAVYTVRGIAYRGMEDYKNALEDFNAVLSLKPNDSHVLVQKGITWKEAGNSDSANFFINKAISKDEDFMFAYYQRAIIAVEDTAWGQALSDLNLIIKNNPFNTGALFYRALVYSQKKEFQKAINDYTEILKKHPDNVMAWYNRAGLYAETEDYKKALEDYDETVKLFPDFAEAYMNRAWVKEKLGRFDEALLDKKMAESVNAINGLKSDELKFRQGRKLKKLTNLDSDFSKSKSDNKIAVQAQNIFILMPDSLSTGDYYDIYGKKAYNSEKIKNTISFSNEFNNLTDSDISKGIDSLSNLIKSNPENILYYLQRAGLYSLQENFNLAMEDYDKALEIDEDNPLVYFARANTNLLLGIFMKDIDNEQYIYINKSQVKIDKKNSINPNFENAIDDYKNALKLDENLYYAWYNLAYARSLSSNHWEGIKDFTKAIKIKPDFAEAFFNRGLTFYFLKEKTKACRDIGKAGELGIDEAYTILDRYCK